MPLTCVPVPLFLPQIHRFRFLDPEVLDVVVMTAFPLAVWVTVPSPAFSTWESPAKSAARDAHGLFKGFIEVSVSKIFIFSESQFLAEFLSQVLNWLLWLYSSVYFNPFWPPMIFKTRLLISLSGLWTIATLGLSYWRSMNLEASWSSQISCFFLNSLSVGMDLPRSYMKIS